MMSPTIPSIIGATLLACAATSGAQPTDVKAPPQPALQAHYAKYGADKWQAPPNQATAPPNATLQANHKKYGPDKWRAAQSEATAPAGAHLQTK